MLHKSGIPCVGDPLENCVALNYVRSCQVSCLVYILTFPLCIAFNNSFSANDYRSFPCFKILFTDAIVNIRITWQGGLAAVGDFMCKVPLVRSINTLIFKADLFCLCESCQRLMQFSMHTSTFLLLLVTVEQVLKSEPSILPDIGSLVGGGQC